MKKIALGICLFALALLFVLNFNAVKADAATVATIDASAVRTEDPIGLRFKAHVEGDFGEGAKFGFIVAKTNGDETVVTMKQYFNANPAKAVFVYCNDVDEYGDYFLSITQIPNTDYLQDITVLACVDVAGEKTYATSVCTRNLYETAISAAADGLRVDDGPVDTILDYIELNYKNYYVDGIRNVNLASPIYETDPAKLYKAFATDWNEVNDDKILNVNATGSTLTDGLKNQLKTSSQTFEAECALVKFFSDDAMSAKWMWLLDYIDNKPTSNTPLSEQIKKLKGSEDDIGINWYYAYNLISRLGGFFIQGNYTAGSGGADWSQYPTLYGLIELANTTVYIDAANANLKAVGSDVALPNFPNKNGYDKKYVEDENDYEIGNNYEITIESKQFIPIYTIVNYSVEFYDGEDKLDSLLPTSYTVESATFNLPEYQKDGYSFDGWYDNAGFEGDPVTSVVKGSTGNKKFYAKTTETGNATVHIDYDLNGGVWDLTTLSTFDNLGEMSLELLNTPREKRFIISNNKTTTCTYWYKLFIKYDPITRLYIVVNEDYGHAVNTIDGNTYDYFLACASGCENAVAKKFFVTDWNTTSNSRLGLYVYIGGDILGMPTNIEATEGQYPVVFYASTAPTKSIEADLILETDLLVPYKAGYEFVGWKNSIDDTVTTTFPGYLVDPGDITYVAQWLAIVDTTFDTNGGTLVGYDVTFTGEAVKTATLQMYADGNVYSGNGSLPYVATVKNGSLEGVGNSGLYQDEVIAKYHADINAYEILRLAKYEVAPDFTEATHAFNSISGWATDNSIIGKYIVLSEDLGEQGEINITAKIYPASAFTTFNMEMGSPIDLPTPVRDGYTFAGWLSSESGTNVTRYPGYVSDPGDITYTAQWIPEN